jgi:hypothetical protein
MVKKKVASTNWTYCVTTVVLIYGQMQNCEYHKENEESCADLDINKREQTNSGMGEMIRFRCYKY